MRISRNAWRASHKVAGHLLVFRSHSLSAYLGSCTLFQSPSALSYWPSSHSAAARAALGSSKSGYLLRRLLRTALLWLEHQSRLHCCSPPLPSQVKCPGSYTIMAIDSYASDPKQGTKSAVTHENGCSAGAPHLSHGFIGLTARIQSQRPVSACKAEGWCKLHSFLVVPS